jgi:beta-phosphoglucomutase
MLGVIFDMDGVLVDSYHAHFKSWQVMAAEVGVGIDERLFASTFGRTSREILASSWGPGRFSEAQITELDRRKEDLFRQIVLADFPPMPGAKDLLLALAQAGFALAIGSSAPPENVEAVLEKMELRSLFDAVVTGADVRRGKPDPQVFLTAAAWLRLPPERCAVVEDAPQGIEAARAAGAAAIGLVSTGHTREQLAAANLLVDRLEQLSPERIEAIIAERLAAAEEESIEPFDEDADDA